MTYYNAPTREQHWVKEKTPSESPMAPRANKNYGYAGHLATLSPGKEQREDLFNRQNYSHRRNKSKYSIYHEKYS